MIIDPKLCIATCGQALIPLSTAQVRSRSRWPGTRRPAAEARLRERFAAAGRATLLAERKGRYVLTGEVWIARCRLNAGRIVLDRVWPAQRIGHYRGLVLTNRHHERWGDAPSPLRNTWDRPAVSPDHD